MLKAIAQRKAFSARGCALSEAMPQALRLERVCIRAASRRERLGLPQVEQLPWSRGTEEVIYISNFMN
ncbi:hypothetical protein H6G35_07695 [Aulosira sp. FACHB-113]|uniref:hypothetical protein n=1 Tax=Tolypothrix tenuis TaxID=457083 RepID=UPI000BBCB917|nr:hypothetical protein [Aulosira sp. FACHB-113]